MNAMMKIFALATYRTLLRLSDCYDSTRPQNMMEREDIRMVKIAFEDPKNCQNNEHKLNYNTVGI
jgi:hypothetical protein